MGRLLNIVVIFFSFCSVFAHDNWQRHVYEMRCVLGLQEDSRIKEWGQFISSKMIDDTGFHRDLDSKFGLSLFHPRYHRMLFHWPYDAEPWNKDLEEYIWFSSKTQKEADETISEIKALLQSEQKYRNQQINSKTEKLFGLASGGKEGKYANNIAALVYDVHVLGDYMSDNTSFKGLPEINYLITHIQNVLSNFDSKESASVRHKINDIKTSSRTPSAKADELMPILIKDVPAIVKKAQGGFLKKRFESQGFKFIDRPWYYLWFD